MLTDPLKKMDKVPYKSLLIVAAGLVFLCQLVAMVLVVNRQVESAQLRDAKSNAFQVATANCAENYTGPNRSRCIQQLKDRLDADAAPDSNVETSGLIRTADHFAGSQSVSRMQELVQPAFATHY